MQIRSSRSEAGFALILAIIALMLLTFLGLALTLSTSTETQMARNYSWSRQAHYNALAGLEVAKSVLTNALINGATDWTTYLPVARDTAAMSNTLVAGSASGSTRDWEGTAGANCDSPVTVYGRNNIGYGRILSDAQPLQDVTTYDLKSIKGAFTVWVRRNTTWTGTQMLDDPNNLHVILTVEGVAPFVNTQDTQATALATSIDASARQMQAVQIVELDFAASTTAATKRAGASDTTTGANESLQADAVDLSCIGGGSAAQVSGTAQ